MSDAQTNDDRGLPWNHILGAFLFQIAGLAVAGWINRHALNPDAVAYLRIASYYAEGKTDLAVSGFWGPLISWLIAPLLKLGVPPLPAARLVMAFSAVFFLASCGRVFHCFGIVRRHFCWGIWTAAIVSIPWSVENITPDLLLSGLIGFAFAEMISVKWKTRPLVPFVSGLWWGVAYLCKAIALPLSVLVTFGFAALKWRQQPQARGAVLRGLTLTLVGIIVVAAPWIATISAQYGELTIANSARLNHSMVGPPDVDRIYPFDRGFHVPETGRITFWEDPHLPYPDWSPVASWGNAALQLEIILRNIPVALVMLTSVHLGFPLIAAIALWRLPRRKADSQSNPPQSWAWLPIIALSALYLPNFLLISEQRYFHPLFPFLFVASVTVLFHDLNDCSSGRESALNSRCSDENNEPAHVNCHGGKIFKQLQKYGPPMLALALLLPTFGRPLVRSGPSRMAGECAHSLAEKISAAQLTGPVAGSARLAGGRAGLYVAYLLNQPWYGDEPSPTAASFRELNARLVIVRRSTALAHDLDADSAFRNADEKLFDSMDEASRFPLQVFVRVAL